MLYLPNGGVGLEIGRHADVCCCHLICRNYTQSREAVSSSAANGLSDVWWRLCAPLRPAKNYCKDVFKRNINRKIKYLVVKVGWARE